MIPLADKSVHMVCTSPPYWPLRDYGVEGQFGLESSMSEYIDNILYSFDEVWRVLRDDGVAWLNLGDSYNGSGGAGGDYQPGGLREGQPKYPRRNEPSLKRKDLRGLPWRVAFALQDKGWWLRCDNVWNKPNAMPEPVRDRPAKSHEYMFLLTKKENYYFDSHAVRVPYKSTEHHPRKSGTGHGLNRADRGTGREFFGNPAGRNLRSVWDIPTVPFSSRSQTSHFATFPPALVEICIKAGTSEYGCCSYCGAPYERIRRLSTNNADGSPYEKKTSIQNVYDTRGWQPTCNHHGVPRMPCTVLDTFSGSGTTLMVARQLGRYAVGIDLSAEYSRLARERLELDRLDEWTHGRRGEKSDFSGLPMFDE
jgi:DNA modification methylase